MRYILSIFILAISTSCFGWGSNSPSFMMSEPTGILETFDTYQNFEGPGVDNGETWGIFGTPNFDYAGVDVIAGSQSLELDFSGTLEAAIRNFTPSSVKYIHFRARSRYTGYGYGMMFAYSASNEQIFKLTVDETEIRLVPGTASSGSGLFTISQGEILHFWLKLDAVNKTGDLYVGSTITRPLTPIATAINGNNIDTMMERIEFKGLGYKGPGTAWYFDQVITSDTEFTSVPAL